MHGLHAVPELSSRIVGVTQTGGLFLLDSSTLEETSSLPAPEQAVTAFRTFVFAGSTCAFGAQGTDATVLVSFFDSGGILTLALASVDSDNGLSLVSQMQLPHTHEVRSQLKIPNI